MPIKENRQKLRSEEIQEILTKVPHWMIVWGNTIILFFVIIFFTFSLVIEYPDIITAEAVISSNIPPQREYSRASGEIDTILITNNETVEKGEILAMIENSADLDDVILLKEYLNKIDSDKNFLHFPIDSIEVMSLGEIAPAYTAFEGSYLNFHLNNEYKPFDNQIDANTTLRSELRTRLDILINQKKISKEAYQFSEKSLDRMRQLYSKGVISQQEYEKEQAKFLQEEQSLKNLNITISQLKQSLNQSKRESTQTIIESKMEEKRLYKRVLLDLNKLKIAIRNWELKYVSKANISGVVSLVGIWNEYQTVAQGDLLFTIIPDSSDYYIAKLKAPVQNSGKIKKGQKVKINLFNYPETEYGVLEGNIAEMSAIPDNEGLFFLTVYLDKNLKTSYDIEIPFRSEMSGMAEIITEDLTLFERVFYNLRNIFKT